MGNLSLRLALWSYFQNLTSMSAVAAWQNLKWPPPPTISLRSLLEKLMTAPVTVSSGVTPPNEPTSPRTTVSLQYTAQGAFTGQIITAQGNLPASQFSNASIAPPAGCVVGPEGRLVGTLRNAAALRDGNKILQMVAQSYAANFTAPGTFSQAILTAMTQLAVTGSNAFAAWSANPTNDLTQSLTGLGMPAVAAATANQQIFNDFNAAKAGVRNPREGIDWNTLRQGLSSKWIAVSGEDDPPDFPVNVPIAPFPQFHQQVAVAVPTESWESSPPNSSVTLNIRYFIASSGAPGPNPTPSIPPGDEVVLYIHGEGSRAEEALDLIPQLFSVGAGAGRSFTVIALDLPGCGYTTSIIGGVRDTPPHLQIATQPPNVSGPVNPTNLPGSPLLDFVQNAIIAFVETAVVPFGNPITAVVGGSQGGHMALRLVASQKSWVGNVVAWSPMSVCESQETIAGIPVPHLWLAGPNLWSQATASEVTDSRQDFFSTVWDQPTFQPNIAEGLAIGTGVAAAAAYTGVAAAALAVAIETAYVNLVPSPPQPQQWYRADWPSTPVYILESRFERWEVYNQNFRQWHWRIGMEMIGFSFSNLAPNMNVPMQLMVGEDDDYPYVHFASYVPNFAAQSLHKPDRALTVQETGHSIHNERPFFLANQIAGFPVT